jgi:hypothetical protein
LSAEIDNEVQFDSLESLSKHYHRQYNFEEVEGKHELISVTLRGLSGRGDGTILAAAELLTLMGGSPMGDTGIVMREPNAEDVMLKDKKNKSVDGLRRMALTSSDRKYKQTLRHTTTEKQQATALKLIQQKQQQLTQLKSTTGIYPCNICSRVYSGNVWLNNHLLNGRHYYGISIIGGQGRSKRKNQPYTEYMTAPPVRRLGTLLSITAPTESTSHQAV